MTRLAVVTDSTASMPEELARRYSIKVAPQVLIWEGKTMLDGIDIQPDEFYDRLKTAEVMPTTSQVTVGAFQQIFEPLVQEGLPIVAILISSKLSGTIQSAEQAKATFPEARIEIVDSQATAMALGFQALAAARAAEEGKSFEEVVTLARRAHEHTGVMFVPDSLEFLHRGGRIGGASRFLGTALNIKPLLHLHEGRVEPLERIRTKGKAVARMLDLIGQRIEGKSPLRLAALHAAAAEEAEALLEQAKARFRPVESFLTVASPVVGAHAGPGTVGLVYSAGL